MYAAQCGAGIFSPVGTARAPLTQRCVNSQPASEEANIKGPREVGRVDLKGMGQ